MNYETKVDSGSEGSFYHGRAGRSDIGEAPPPRTGESAADLDARQHELNDLRGQLAEIARHLENLPPQPVVGVVYPGTGWAASLDQLRMAVALAELRRRLTGVRVVACATSTDPTTLFDGEPVYPALGARGSDTIALDCVVAPEPGDRAVADLSDRLGVPAHDLCALWPGGSYDALALMDRVLEPEFIAQRGHYLRIVGTVPKAARFMLASFDAQDFPPAEVATTTRITGLEPVVPPDEVAPVDLVAMVGAADLVVTDRLAVAALSAGLLQPVILIAGDDRKRKWAEEAGVMSGTSSDLVALAGEVFAQETLTRPEQLVRNVDLSFDELAGSILTSLAGCITRTAGVRLTDLVTRVQILESINEGLRRTMVRDRKTLYDRIAALDIAAVAAASAPVPRNRLQMDPRMVAEAEIHIAQLQDEIGQIYATRLFRYSKPARKLYGRVRSLVR
jgi:hypothetical protein